VYAAAIFTSKIFWFPRFTQPSAGIFAIAILDTVKSIIVCIPKYLWCIRISSRFQCRSRDDWTCDRQALIDISTEIYFATFFQGVVSCIPQARKTTTRQWSIAILDTLEFRPLHVIFRDMTWIRCGRLNSWLSRRDHCGFHRWRGTGLWGRRGGWFPRRVSVGKLTSTAR